jgi:hypothetical protein
VNFLTLILAGLLLIAIIILIVQYVRENSLKSALASLLTIFASLVAALAAPEMDGHADFNLDLGFLGRITGQWVKVSTSRPLVLWVISFASVLMLIAYVLYLLHDVRIREMGKPRP